jgi:hypothetical protein
MAVASIDIVGWAWVVHSALECVYGWEFVNKRGEGVRLTLNAFGGFLHGEKGCILQV